VHSVVLTWQSQPDIQDVGDDARTKLKAGRDDDRMVTDAQLNAHDRFQLGLPSQAPKRAGKWKQSCAQHATPIMHIRSNRYCTVSWTCNGVGRMGDQRSQYSPNGTEKPDKGTLIEEPKKALRSHPSGPAHHVPGALERWHVILTLLYNGTNYPTIWERPSYSILLSS
jgi:hypothetical protein